jgi:ribosomal protein S18 acetylase RimI-like enzyme
MNIEIRPVANHEVEEIAALARDIWQQHYTPMIGQAQVDYMLAQRYNKPRLIEELDRVGIWWDQLLVDGTRAGFASYHLTGVPGEMKLDKLYIHPAQQRRGLGGALITHVADQARAQHCDSLILAVNKQNSQAIAAYQKHGFVVRESVQVDIGQGFVMDDYIMVKSLH